MKNFDIIKSFDVFNAEAVSILKSAIVKFMHIETDYYEELSALNADIDGDTVSLTVVNNPKMYNLLTLSWARQKKRLENENNKSGIH